MRNFPVKLLVLTISTKVRSLFQYGFTRLAKASVDGKKSVCSLASQFGSKSGLRHFAQSHAARWAGEPCPPPIASAIPADIELSPPPQAEAGQVSALPTEGKRRQETELVGGGEGEHFVDGGGDAIVGLGLNERTRTLTIVHRDTHVSKVVVCGKEIYPHDRAAHELKGLECAAWLTKAGVNMSHVG